MALGETCCFYANQSGKIREIIGQKWSEITFWREKGDFKNLTTRTNLFFPSPKGLGIRNYFTYGHDWTINPFAPSLYNRTLLAQLPA